MILCQKQIHVSLTWGRKHHHFKMAAWWSSVLLFPKVTSEEQCFVFSHNLHSPHRRDNTYQTLNTLRFCWSLPLRAITTAQQAATSMTSKETNITFFTTRIEVSFIFWLRQWKQNWNCIIAKENTKDNLLIVILIQLGDFPNQSDRPRNLTKCHRKVSSNYHKTFLKDSGPKQQSW